MRQIGTIPTAEQAERFRDYLLTQGTHTSLDDEGDGWSVWVHDEDRIAAAKTELQQFLAAPDDSRYRDAEQQAAEVREEKIRRFRESRKKQIRVRDQWERPVPQSCPATFALLALSLLVALVSAQGAAQFSLNTLGQSSDALFRTLAFVPEFMREGEVWRLITPIFLHGGPLHLLFNMMWLWDFGLMIEYRKGTLKYMLIVLLIAVVSNSAQYWWSGPGFGGMSGVNYGLFGYIWMKSRYDPRDNFSINPSSVTLLVLWFLLGFTGYVGNIANFAHGGGLLTGIILGLAPVAWRNLTRRSH